MKVLSLTVHGRFGLVVARLGGQGQQAMFEVLITFLSLSSAGIFAIHAIDALRS